MSPSRPGGEPDPRSAAAGRPSTSILIVRSRCQRAPGHDLPPRAVGAGQQHDQLPARSGRPTWSKTAQLSPQRLGDVRERLLGELVAVALARSASRSSITTSRQLSGPRWRSARADLLRQALLQRLRPEPPGASRPGGVRASRWGRWQPSVSPIESRFGPGVRSPAPRPSMNPAALRGKGWSSHPARPPFPAPRGRCGCVEAAVRPRALVHLLAMLAELRVENLLLIERAELRLAPGLNVLTGETGAGKTVLAHALDLLLGGRSRAGIVRPGAEEAYVEGVFEVPRGSGVDSRSWSSWLGDAEQAHEVVLARRVRADGRTRALINGRTAAVADLRAIGGSSAALLRPARAPQPDARRAPSWRSSTVAAGPSSPRVWRPAQTPTGACASSSAGGSSCRPRALSAIGSSTWSTSRSPRSRPSRPTHRSTSGRSPRASDCGRWTRCWPRRVRRRAPAGRGRRGRWHGHGDAGGPGRPS